VVTLEIDTDSDPIAGRLSEGGAPDRPFVGWLGLARALELALEPCEPAPGCYWGSASSAPASVCRDAMPSLR
jgi:hypothetical protein